MEKLSMLITNLIQWMAQVLILIQERKNAKILQEIQLENSGYLKIVAHYLPYLTQISWYFAKYFLTLRYYKTIK